MNIVSLVAGNDHLNHLISSMFHVTHDIEAHFVDMHFHELHVEVEPVDVCLSEMRKTGIMQITLGTALSAHCVNTARW